MCISANLTVACNALAVLLDQSLCCSLSLVLRLNTATLFGGDLTMLGDRREPSGLFPNGAIGPMPSVGSVYVYPFLSRYSEEVESITKSHITCFLHFFYIAIFSVYTTQAQRYSACHQLDYSINQRWHRLDHPQELQGKVKIALNTPLSLEWVTGG
jgi:hypothetical protein